MHFLDSARNDMARCHFERSRESAHSEAMSQQKKAFYLTIIQIVTFAVHNFDHAAIICCYYHF